MRSTALPLRLANDGKLVQADRFDAILSVIQAMAGTSTQAWPHAPWFGLQEAFTEAARRDREDHEGLRDAINAGLRELGVTDYRVQALVTGPVTPDGHRVFRLTLLDPEGRAVFGEMPAG
jgi:hypothetical protein